MSESLLDLQRPQHTGGFIVSFREGVDLDTQSRTLTDAAHADVRILSLEPGAEVSAEDLEGLVLLGDTGLGIISHASADQTSQIASTLRAQGNVESVRPEFYLFALSSFQDDSNRTWGIAAVGAETSSYTGKGIKVAVLDTGLEAGHPDFQGRQIVTKSFVTGESADDGHGHGTHCAGTAVGGRAGRNGLRYGVASSADLFVGKVLNNRGAGRERDILNGMLWAINAGCDVISMSLGRAVRPGEPPAPEYERLGRRALANGSLVVAAAGNNSSRNFGFIAPVDAPADSGSVMAVAAVDHVMNIAEFSNGGINPNGGQVDLAGPGVGVMSSVPQPESYKKLSGTSMACPQVAGVAALWAESDPKLRATALWNKLIATAKHLSLPRRDVGAGLVQAP